jgi:hypothetical protein
MRKKELENIPLNFAEGGEEKYRVVDEESRGQISAYLKRSNSTFICLEEQLS